jgi:protein TonB
MKQSDRQDGVQPHVVRDASAPMFGTLLASSPARDTRRAAIVLIGSMLAHTTIVAALAWATMAVGQEILEEEQVTLIELPPETAPPPPPPPPQIAAPETPSVDVARGFQTLSMPDIVPPDIPPLQSGIRIDERDFGGTGSEGGRAAGRVGAPPDQDLAAAPVFTPMTVRPELLNTREVQRELVRAYPSMLRDAGIGGTTVMWFFIDETGTVANTRISRSSGHPPLDEAAVRVAGVMKFSPAVNRDRKVRVWVELPIVFTAH